MQTSQVFSQRTWPGANPPGETTLDDCWVLSAIQALNVVDPGARLVGSKVFRAAAGDPDDGDRDGGQLAEIIAGIEGCFPQYKGKLKAHRGVSYDVVRRLLAEGRPLSLATAGDLLPDKARYGVTVPHQVTVAQPTRLRGTDRALVANPMAPAYSSWVEVTLSELRPSVMGYGRKHSAAQAPGAWFVAFPTEDEVLRLSGGFDAAVTAAAADRVHALDGKYKAALDARTTALRAIASEAASAAESPPTP